MTTWRCEQKIKIRVKKCRVCGQDFSRDYEGGETQRHFRKRRACLGVCDDKWKDRLSRQEHHHRSPTILDDAIRQFLSMIARFAALNGPVTIYSRDCPEKLEEERRLRNNP